LGSVVRKEGSSEQFAMKVFTFWGGFLNSQPK
jgi:hypothetical protein